MNSGSWFWPDVSDLDGAKDAARYGMWCAFLVAGSTALFALLSFFGIRLMGITPAALLDAALFGAIGFGLSRYSRFAAVAGFLLFLLEKIYALVTTGSILGVGVLGVIILFGLLNGIRGAFAYQKLLAAVPPQPVPGPS
jgi:hypothetical protein